MQKLSKVKEFVKAHSDELEKAGIYIGGLAIGLIIGQWTMIPMRTEIRGEGMLAMFQYIECNGPEAAKELIKKAFNK